MRASGVLAMSRGCLHNEVLAMWVLLVSVTSVTSVTSMGTGKKTPGGAGTHTGHTRDTLITQTNLTTIQTQRHTRTGARPRDGQNRGRLNSRRPRADRSTRPTQKRPPPANPTLPPPAPRAPPRAGKCSMTGTGGGSGSLKSSPVY